MKPPAATGASRDIFGASFTGTPSHNRVLKPPGGGSSDIFGTTGSEQMEPPQQAASRRVKNHFASNLFMGDEPSSQGAPTPSKTPESNGDAHDGGHSEAKTNGNIAAMNGSAAMNGNNIKSVMTNGNAATTNGNGPSPAAPRQRVPPGGYSSGLW